MEKILDEKSKKHIDLPKGYEENDFSPYQRNLCYTSVEVFIRAHPGVHMVIKE